MNVTAAHRYLLDTETLVDRAQIVALIAESLRLNPVWKDDGAIGRQRAAHRIGFMRWAAETGEINEADYPSAALAPTWPGYASEEGGGV